MKSTPLQYATALAAALKGKNAAERKQIAWRLFRHLAASRALKHRDRILRAAARMERQREGVVAADVQSASPLGKNALRTMERALGKKAVIAETVDPRLLGGVRVLIDEETLIDATALRRLATLFQL